MPTNYEILTGLSRKHMHAFIRSLVDKDVSRYIDWNAWLKSDEPDPVYLGEDAFFMDGDNEIACRLLEETDNDGTVTRKVFTLLDKGAVRVETLPVYLVRKASEEEYAPAPVIPVAEPEPEEEPEAPVPETQAVEEEPVTAEPEVIREVPEEKTAEPEVIREEEPVQEAVPEAEAAEEPVQTIEEEFAEAENLLLEELLDEEIPTPVTAESYESELREAEAFLMEDLLGPLEEETAEDEPAAPQPETAEEAVETEDIQPEAAAEIPEEISEEETEAVSEDVTAPEEISEPVTEEETEPETEAIAEEPDTEAEDLDELPEIVTKTVEEEAEPAIEDEEIFTEEPDDLLAKLEALSNEESEEASLSEEEPQEETAPFREETGEAETAEQEAEETAPEEIEEDVGFPQSEDLTLDEMLFGSDEEEHTDAEQTAVVEPETESETDVFADEDDEELWRQLEEAVNEADKAEEEATRSLRFDDLWAVSPANLSAIDPDDDEEEQEAETEDDEVVDFFDAQEEEAEEEEEKDSEKEFFSRGRIEMLKESLFDDEEEPPLGTGDLVFQETTAIEFPRRAKDDYLQDEQEPGFADIAVPEDMIDSARSAESTSQFEFDPDEDADSFFEKLNRLTESEEAADKSEEEKESADIPQEEKEEEAEKEPQEPETDGDEEDYDEDFDLYAGTKVFDDDDEDADFRSDGFKRFLSDIKRDSMLYDPDDPEDQELPTIAFSAMNENKERLF